MGCINPILLAINTIINLTKYGSVIKYIKFCLKAFKLKSNNCNTRQSFHGLTKNKKPLSSPACDIFKHIALQISLTY